MNVSRETSDSSVARASMPAIRKRRQEHPTFHVKHRPEPEIPLQVRQGLEGYRDDPMLRPVLSDSFIDRMAIFASALALWGARINLTARPQDPEEITFHIVDSLMPLVARRGQSLSPLPHSVVGEGEGEGSDTLQAQPDAFTSGRRVLDFGSGAGFPGLILASARTASFTLAEARQKRASFLKIAAAEMALDNVEIFPTRIYPFTFASTFDAILSRASGPTRDFYEIAVNALAAGGVAILYSSPSQRLDLVAAGSYGLGDYRRYRYTLKRGSGRVERMLATWRKPEKDP
jgi:16S rRNA G527 N7-methylase RsmG